MINVAKIWIGIVAFAVPFKFATNYHLNIVKRESIIEWQTYHGHVKLVSTLGLGG